MYGYIYIVIVGLSGVMGVDAGYSQGKENIKDNSTTYDESTVKAKKDLIFESGTDTNIQGGTFTGEKVTGKVGGNLNIESKQDSKDLESKSSSAGLGLSYNPTGGVSVTGGASKGNIESQYDSVTSQSGIYAGKEGFDISVEKNTDLKGAVIGSKAPAEKNQLTTGTLTWENQQNNACYKASASGTNIQGTSTDGKIHGGITPVRTQDAKDHAESTTKAGVAEGSITITDKENQKQDIEMLNRDTKNSLNKLAQIFDKDDIKERQEIVNTFNQIAFKKIGDIAQEQGWSENDSRRAALHALVGGMSAALGGGDIISGAAGSGVNERLQPIISKFVKDNPDLKEWVSLLVGDAIGKLSGDENAGQASAWSGTKYNDIAHIMVNPAVIIAGYTVVNLANGTQQIQNAAGEVVGYISTAGEFIFDGADDAVWQFSGFIEEHENIFPESLVLWTKKTRLSGKEKASDSPSWVDSLDDYVRPGESGKDFAKRVYDEKFGPGNYPTGQASDYNRIKKRVDRDPNYKRMPNER